MFTAGAAFLMRGGAIPAPHLWIVLCDPPPHAASVVIVMLVSPKTYTDKTTILTPADHPWIRHDSHVDYGTARVVPLSKLETALRSGRIVMETPLRPDVLDRIRRGVFTSSRTIHAVRDECAERLHAVE